MTREPLADGLPLDLRDEIYRLEAEIEGLKAEKINLLNWLNTHHPHVAIAWARAQTKPLS